jgi:hypothetical protein
MPRHVAVHANDRRAARTTLFETLFGKVETLLEEVRQGQHELREEMRQGQHAITEQLDRIAVRVEQKHGGGHPLQYPWRSVELAIYGHANLNRFDTRAELFKFTIDLIAKWPRQPTEPAVKRFLEPIADAMGLIGPWKEPEASRSN